MLHVAKQSKIAEENKNKSNVESEKGKKIREENERNMYIILMMMTFFIVQPHPPSHT